MVLMNLRKILYPDGIPVNIPDESIPLSKEEKEVQEEFDKYGITTSRIYIFK